MREIAVELAHRAEPEHLKALAREKAAELKETARDKAHTEFESLKDRAKEKAMHQTIEMKDRFVSSPSRSYVGAALGAGLGYWAFKKLLGRRFREEEETQVWVGSSYAPGYAAPGYYEQVPNPAVDVRTGMAAEVAVDNDYAAVGAYGVEGDVELRGGDRSPGMKDRAQDAIGNVKDRAQDAIGNVKERAQGAIGNVKDRVSDRMHSVGDRMHSMRDGAAHLRERIPPAWEMKQRGSDYYARIAREQPALVAAGAIAVGVLASLLIPVSAKERRMIAPAKEQLQDRVIQPAIAKAQSAVDKVGQQAEDKLQPPPSGLATASEGVMQTTGSPQTVSAAGVIIPPVVKS